ncbi:glycosyltransferase family 2 protein [Candidatus Kaiserbacteria bacterium]|nr:glycosyltransferase family 2 protein [Candidatus Kaiserbacteria bacterium]
MKKLISIVVPVYNEQENIQAVYTRISAAMSGSTYEILFVNDGSTDMTGGIIEDIVAQDKKVKYIEFSRNFSKEMAVTAGIQVSRGDAIVTLDADLQHPPELLPEFIACWEQGAEMVIGVRDIDVHESFVKRVGSRIFYKIINVIGDIEFVPRSTDFRLIDRRVADEFNKFTERNRITRGILDWVGFKKKHVIFRVAERSRGTSSYSNRKLFKLALSAVISHSTFPLRIIGYLGAFITFFSAVLGLFIIVEDILLGDPFGLNISGTAMIAVLILFLIGVVIMWLGLIAFYMLNIQREVMNRPMYVIHHTRNVQKF